jgi:hypothetical protein
MGVSTRKVTSDLGECEFRHLQFPSGEGTS